MHEDNAQVNSVQMSNVERLDAGQLSAVLALVEAATDVDKVAPLSEQVLLAARSSPPAEGPGTPSPHFLLYAGTHLAGYAHLERGPTGQAATAEVVVHPADRRKGLGTILIQALEAAVAPDGETLQLWSHGNLSGARSFAARDDYSSVRELWAMRRPLQSDAAPLQSDSSTSESGVGALPAVSLPEGFTARHFVVGQDEEAWLRVNTRAFADHAEQGRMTRRDLDLRIAEPWFDATGFILVEDTGGGAARGLGAPHGLGGADDAVGSAAVLAASHWTKVVPPEDPQARPTQGEVYVVGVEPAYQGLGLGRAVTVLGLAHLRDRGLTEAVLYVDADNVAAVATYSRLGFTRFAVDVMYSPTVHPPVTR